MWRAVVSGLLHRVFTVELLELLNIEQGPAFLDEVYKRLTLTHRVGSGNHLPNAAVLPLSLEEPRKCCQKGHARMKMTQKYPIPSGISPGNKLAIL